MNELVGEVVWFVNSEDFNCLIGKRYYRGCWKRKKNGCNWRTVKRELGGESYKEGGDFLVQYEDQEECVEQDLSVGLPVEAYEADDVVVKERKRRMRHQSRESTPDDWMIVGLEGRYLYDRVVCFGEEKVEFWSRLKYKRKTKVVVDWREGLPVSKEVLDFDYVELRMPWE
jgi:hypothetical protein